MSRIYDNWERLVAAALKRQQFREMALAPPSAESSFRSTQSDVSSFDSNSHDELAGILVRMEPSPAHISLRSVCDLFAGEIATELLKQLFNIVRKSAACRSSAEQLIVYIQQLQPIIQEIIHSGNELPQFRQRQLDGFSETLSGGLDLAAKVLNCPRWNVYRNHRLARKMEKLEHSVSRFMNRIPHEHLLADVCQGIGMGWGRVLRDSGTGLINRFRSGSRLYYLFFSIFFILSIFIFYVFVFQ